MHLLRQRQGVTGENAGNHANKGANDEPHTAPFALHSLGEVGVGVRLLLTVVLELQDDDVVEPGAREVAGGHAKQGGAGQGAQGNAVGSHGLHTLARAHTEMGVERREGTKGGKVSRITS